LAQQTMSLARIPIKLWQDLANTKWTKKNVSWALAYIYTLYVALSAVPPLKGNVAFSVSAASGLLVLLYLFHSFTNLSLKTAGKFLVIAAVISYLWEFIGVETGIPFGSYYYTNALGPKIGPVPIAIPLIWCALGYFCMQASDHYIMASALMVTLDLSFDPVFSGSLHLWNWTGQTQYFGVPLTNFFGWFIASLTFFAVFYYTTKRGLKLSKQAIAFYYLFGLDNVVGDLVSGPATLAAASFVIFTLATMVVILIHRSGAAKTRVLATEQVAGPTRQPIASE
jgi:uncharacterized membrane protein